MLRTLAFGDLNAGTWGAIWDLADARFALFGADSNANAVSAHASVDGVDADVTWYIAGPGIELEASPEGESGRLGEGFEQLTRVYGTWSVNGVEHRVECLGRRGTRDAIDRGRFEVVRDVSAWFDPDLGMALIAGRPRGSESHGDDVLSACVFEEGHALAVEDPRLSTTYGPSGLPTRASLELWLEPEEAEDPGQQDDEPVRRFPRRAAGEALGARGSASTGFLDARAELFRWHARGREGAGVYVIARLAQA
jgi:hypothetical protein